MEMLNAGLEQAHIISVLRDRVAHLERALGEIAHSPHCMYEANASGMYGIGVTDGHRYAAKVARKALGDRVDASVVANDNPE